MIRQAAAALNAAVRGQLEGVRTVGRAGPIDDDDHKADGGELFGHRAVAVRYPGLGHDGGLWRAVDHFDHRVATGRVEAQGAVQGAPQLPAAVYRRYEYAAVDLYHREEELAAKAAAALGDEHTKNWLKVQPWSANEVLTSAGKCKLAEDRMARAAKNKTSDYDEAYASGQKTCLFFSEEYADFSRAYGAGALPYLWRYCGENHDKKLCAAMQNWIETHQ